MMRKTFIPLALFILLVPAIHAQTVWTLCIDGDGGFDYYNQSYGYAEYTLDGNPQVFNNSDFCQNSTVVREYYCDGNRVRSQGHPCELGCVDGACVMPEPVIPEFGSFAVGMAAIAIAFAVVWHRRKRE